MDSTAVPGTGENFPPEVDTGLNINRFWAGDWPGPPGRRAPPGTLHPHPGGDAGCRPAPAARRPGAPPGPPGPAPARPGAAGGLRLPSSGSGEAAGPLRPGHGGSGGTGPWDGTSGDAGPSQARRRGLGARGSSGVAGVRFGKGYKQCEGAGGRLVGSGCLITISRAAGEGS